MPLARILLRRDTTADWSSANPVLAAGEPAVDLTTGVFKIGNGVDAWNDLDPISGGGGGGSVPEASTTTSGTSRRATDAEAAAGTVETVTVNPKQVLAAIAAAGASQVLVWRWTGGAYPALPATRPAGVRLVHAIGPTQPSSPPSWVGREASQVPALYSYMDLL